MKRLIPILAACAAGTGVSGQAPECDPAAAPEAHRALLLDGLVVELSLGLGLAGATVVVESRDAGEWRAIGTTTAAGDGSYALCVHVSAETDSVRLRAELVGAAGAYSSLANPVTETEDEPTLSGGHVLEVDLENRGPEAGNAIEVGSAVSAVGYTVRGRVIEFEDDQGISGALVGLRRTGAHTFTAADGAFSLAFRDPDPDTLFIEHLGYRAVAVAVQPRADAVVSVSARLAPEPLGLEPIVVTAVRHPKLETRGFYERKEWGENLGLGTFMSLEELESMHATRISSILDRLPSVSLVRVCTPSCRLLPKMASAVPKRGGNSVTGYFMSPCPANVYIDGVPARLFTFDRQNRLKVNAGIDELGIPAEVLAIEVYTRTSQLPAEFGGVQEGCGAVAIWTK